MVRKINLQAYLFFFFFIAPRHGNWGSWQNWGSVQCQNGFQTRYRYCNNPRPGFGGSGCSGRRSETRDCDECSLGLSQCEHLCSNRHGSFTCSCYSGYKPSTKNWKRCESKYISLAEKVRGIRYDTIRYLQLCLDTAFSSAILKLLSTNCTYLHYYKYNIIKFKTMDPAFLGSRD